MKSWLVAFLLVASVTWGQGKGSKVDPLEQAALEFALSADELKGLEGKPARLVLSTGEVIDDGVLKKFAATKEGNRFRSLDVQLGGKATRKLTGDKLLEIEVEERVYRLRGIASQKAYVLENGEAKSEAVKQRMGGEGKVWSPQSEEQRASSLASQKGFLDKVEAHFAKRKLTRQETEHFLLITDAPADLWKGRLQLLEKTAEALERTLRVRPGTPVWPGKVTLISFRAQADYRELEEAVQKTTGPMDDTLVTLIYDDGDNAIVQGHEGEDPDYLAYCYVQYVARAYLDYYPTSFPLPSWLEAATADWIAGGVMPAAKRPGGCIADGQIEAANLVRSAGSLERFFDQEAIYEEQWGIASVMSDLLVKISPDRYLLFVTSVKEGQPWEEALERIYGMTRRDLTAGYGRAAGIPNLAK